MKAYLILILFALARPGLAKSDSTIIGGAHVHDNLTVWAIEGSDEIPQPYCTLEQAIADGEAVIHNENSQTLWIENRSDTDLFLQSGDLIKGGQQDRMIASDRILPAKDTARDLEVYCIERGRSTQRGIEPFETFSSSDWIAPFAHTRLVARHNLTEELLTPHVGGLTAPDTDKLKLLESLANLPQPLGSIDAAQESVWNDVATVQTQLTTSLKESVTGNASPTSLELSLENNSLAKREHFFENHIDDLAQNDSRAVGFVYAIDGKIVGAERYASHSLFTQMWPKLLRSVVAAAIASPNGAETSQTSMLSNENIRQFLNAQGHGSARQTINSRTLIEASKTDDATRFLLWDRKFSQTPLHSEWIATQFP